MTPDEHEFIKNVIGAATDAPQKLNEWERGFIKDFGERIEKYGLDAHCSPKQWTVVAKMADKLEVYR